MEALLMGLRLAEGVDLARIAALSGVEEAALIDRAAAEKLAALTGLDQVYFCNSGAEADICSEFRAPEVSTGRSSPPISWSAVSSTVRNVDAGFAVSRVASSAARSMSSRRLVPVCKRPGVGTSDGAGATDGAGAATLSNSESGDGAGGSGATCCALSASCALLLAECAAASVLPEADTGRGLSSCTPVCFATGTSAALAR